MSYHFYHFVIISLCVIPCSAYAEITLDGSFGPAMELSGPNYLIEADKGTLMGRNLFHSFKTFDLNHNESATFAGPHTVANIIGRVTGGNLSNIEGTLTSTIQNADLYLLNPAGFMVGRNAVINVNGSFYLSSADYLRFADGQRFETDSSKPPLLSIAAPEAFGFLDNQIGQIAINGRMKVAEAKELAVIGGDIRITGGDLFAPKGYINIISAASAGEVMRSQMMNNTFSQFGNVTIEQRSFLDVNAEQGKAGSVVIRGGQFFMSHSHIQTMGDGTGDIEVTASHQLQITDHSQIGMATTQEKAGKIVLQGQHIKLSNGGVIRSASFGQGPGGNLTVEAAQLEITETAGIGTSSQASGKGGLLNVVARDAIYMNNGQIQAVTFGTGDAGDIVLETNHLTLEKGAHVNASSEGAGKGGQIDVNVTGTIDISGFGYLADTETGELTNQISPSGIASSAFSSGQGGNVQISAQTLNLDNWGTIQTLTKGDGNAGQIGIEVHDLRLTNGGDIDASNEGTGSGKGGNIDIRANGSVLMTAQPADDETIGPAKSVVKQGFLGGIYSIAENEGRGGDVTLTTPKLELRDGGVISVGSIGFGNAGNLKLFIDNGLQMENAAMMTRATQAGGGDIHIETSQAHLINSAITAEAQGTEPYHHGGNLAIENARLLTLDNSQLLANAKWGRGGNIAIHAEQMQAFGNSQINVSSEFGLNGQLFLNDSELSVLTVLPLDYLKAAKWLKQRCVSRFKQELNHFNIVTYQMLPLSPYDFHALMPLFNGLSIESAQVPQVPPGAIRIQPFQGWQEDKNGFSETCGKRKKYANPDRG